MGVRYRVFFVFSFRGVCAGAGLGVQVCPRSQAWELATWKREAGPAVPSPCGWDVPVSADGRLHRLLLHSGLGLGLGRSPSDGTPYRPWPSSSPWSPLRGAGGLGAGSGSAGSCEARSGASGDGPLTGGSRNRSAPGPELTLAPYKDPLVSAEELSPSRCRRLYWHQRRASPVPGRGKCWQDQLVWAS